jgi:riboflavin kinase/FMN adenylyltransferase
LLAATGLDGALVLTFDAAFAALTAGQFVARILVGRLGIRGATIGFDFHFGHNRQGSPKFLAGEGERYGFSVETAPPLEDEGRPVSSSSIRAALAEGRVVEAAELLGYPWFASGPVVPGDRRGRDLGFPTANIALDPDCGLKHGIYAVRVGIGP